MPDVFIKGLIVGLGASVPLGPIAILCIQKTISRGKLSGFFTGLGATVSDTFYSMVSLLGLSFVNTLVETHKNFVFMLGGIIILTIGALIFSSNPLRQMRQRRSKKRHVGDFFQGLAMAITNPGSLVLIFAMFTVVRLDFSKLDYETTKHAVHATLWGIFAGSALWWYTLSTIINVFRKRFRIRQLIVLNKIAGIVIATLGLISFGDGLYSLILLH